MLAVTPGLGGWGNGRESRKEKGRPAGLFALAFGLGIDGERVRMRLSAGLLDWVQEFDLDLI